MILVLLATTTQILKLAPSSRTVHLTQFATLMEDLKKEPTPSDVEMKSLSEEGELSAKSCNGDGMRKGKRGRFM